MLTQNVPIGEHKYKFLINGYIKLNDPNANMYTLGDDETLWSALIVNEDDMRLYNNTPYTVHIEDYSLTSYVYEGEIRNSRKDFNLLLDKKNSSKTFLHKCNGYPFCNNAMV